MERGRKRVYCDECSRDPPARDGGQARQRVVVSAQPTVSRQVVGPRAAAVRVPGPHLAPRLEVRADLDTGRPRRRASAVEPGEHVADRPGGDQRLERRVGRAGRPAGQLLDDDPRRGSCSPRWASTHRRHAVTTGHDERADRVAGGPSGPPPGVRARPAGGRRPTLAVGLAVRDHQRSLGRVAHHATVAGPQQAQRVGGRPGRRPRPTRVPWPAVAGRLDVDEQVRGEQVAQGSVPAAGVVGAGDRPAARSASSRRTSGSSGTTTRHGWSRPIWRWWSSRRTTCRPGRSWWEEGRLMPARLPAGDHPQRLSTAGSPVGNADGGTGPVTDRAGAAVPSSLGRYALCVRPCRGCG